MNTVFVISLVVPFAVAAALLAARNRLPKLAADTRGIALQTVIIMVVLLAIAGGVSAVLIASGGDAVDDLENQQVTREASDYDNATLCDAAGFTWDATNTTCG
ncbi:MAG: hypothetical protein OXG66_02585 [Acidimicrobiaceae bacterium]|nr:hypothetical protein [Acidimicrobiaceae bacterium]